MTLYDYRISQRLELEDVPFYALIMAAMRKADSRNLVKLMAAWPEVHAELLERYHAPGGLIGSEAEAGRPRVERTEVPVPFVEGDVP